LTQIPNYIAYKNIESSPRKTNIGEVETIKVLYDFLDDKIYYIQSEKYDFHYLFAASILDYNKSWQHFNTTQYYENPERRYYNFVINYQKSLNIYAIEFFGGDEISCEATAETVQKVKSTSFFGDSLYVLNNHPRLDTCHQVEFISTQELYRGLSYQPLSLQKTFGYLRKVDINVLEETYLGKRDVVVLNGLPNDLSVVSGIITSQFQTDLSHINVLSHNRKTPNMALKNAWENEKINGLEGKLVYLEVLADSFILREANLEEATVFWQIKEPQNPVILTVDSTDKGLVDFKDITRQAVNRVGGKAANFSVMYNLSFVPVPENSFAIPVTFYLRHLKNNGIDLIINKILNDSAFKSNQLVRKEKLIQIQKLIKNAAIDTNLVKLVSQKINYFADYPSYRFRSSTNAEDLDFFSGAGLYDSYKAEKDNPKKTIEEAIKKVWASAWNFRAFEEREYYKIDHFNVAMGVLVHRAFPDEEANGVIVTRNLYNTNSGIIINAQFGEESVVYPENGVLNDEIMVYYYSISEETDITVEYLSRSSILPNGKSTVLEYKEIEELAAISSSLKNHYYYIETPNCNCTYGNFALDIEFKINLEGGKRKVYIKQVRPFQ
jgi:pyruvate, water dikinase